MFGSLRSLALARSLGRASLVARPRLLSLQRPVIASLPSVTRPITTTPYTNAVAAPATRSSRDVDDLEKSAEQSASSDDVRATFASIKDSLHEPIYRAITKKPFQYDTMSEVQEAVLALLPRLSSSPSSKPLYGADTEGPNAIEQAQDLLVRAKTGTGKTLAFLVPALEGRVRQLEAFKAQWKVENPDQGKVQQQRALAKFAKSSVGALILSPTRELATQIANEAQALMSHIPDFGVRLLVGGASRSNQYRDWTRAGSNDIVVATPGRCLDFLESEDAFQGPLATSRMLILDEADTLLDMGFADAISTISSYLPDIAERQTFLFSATVSKQIREIARKSLKKDHVFVDTVRADDVDTHLHIPQYYTVLPTAEDQLTHVLRLLAHDQLLHARKAAENGGQEGGKAVIFLPTTRMTQMFSLVLSAMKAHLPWARDTHIVEIHSKKDQNQRTRASDSFRKNKSGYSILVTSDVSARGVDYPGVTRVIQIGIPGSRDLYIHRVGRTGRAGKEGRGDIVLLPWESKYVSSQLRDIPMQPFSTQDAERALVEIAHEWDNNPAETRPLSGTTDSTRSSDRRAGKFSRDRRIASPRAVEIATPVEPRLDSLEDSLRTSVLPSLDEEAIRETFASLLGYYVTKSPELRVSKDQILSGLKEWATGSMGLEEEPHVSSMFLQKIGMSNRSGRDSDRRGDRGGFGSRGGERRDFGAGRGGNARSFGGDYSSRSRSGGYEARTPSRSYDRTDSASSSRGSGYGGRGEKSDRFGSQKQDGGESRPRSAYKASAPTGRKPSFGYGGASSPYDTNEADSWERKSPRSRY